METIQRGQIPSEVLWALEQIIEPVVNPEQVIIFRATVASYAQSIQQNDGLTMHGTVSTMQSDGTVVDASVEIPQSTSAAFAETVLKMAAAESILFGKTIIYSKDAYVLRSNETPQAALQIV